MTRDMLRVNSHTEPLLPDDTLHYAPAPPKRHRILRRATWWVFGIAVATFAIICGWRLATQIHYLWLQHELMTYNLPDGPMRMLADGQVENPTAWPRAADIAPRPYSHDFFRPVFIHQRVAPNGAERLIIVADFGMSSEKALGAIAYLPATLRLRSKMEPTSALVLDHEAWQVHGGRIDPNDDSHFTIAYETDRGKGVIDGWLMNDGQLK